MKIKALAGQVFIIWVFTVPVLGLWLTYWISRDKSEALEARMEASEARLEVLARGGSPSDAGVSDPDAGIPDLDAGIFVPESGFSSARITFLDNYRWNNWWNNYSETPGSGSEIFKWSVAASMAASDLGNVYAGAADLPVGSVVVSVLKPADFYIETGDGAIFDPDKSKWAVADGRQIPSGSQYSRITGRLRLPDLTKLLGAGSAASDIDKVYFYIKVN
jgi:hypothetical protein